MSRRLAKVLLDAESVLNSLSDRTVVVDGSGAIEFSNQSWNAFLSDSGGSPTGAGVGANYLDVCARSLHGGCFDAGLAADCVIRVLGGAAEQSSMVYECSTPEHVQWFAMRVSLLAGPGERWAMVSHQDVTSVKNAEDAASHVIGAPPGGIPVPSDLPAFGVLSRHEKQVVLGLLRGDRVNAIAAGLFVSPSTVRSQLSSAYAKLRIRSQQELIDLVRSELLSGGQGPR